MSMSDMIGWGSASDVAQWIQKGQEYFANGMYKLAAGCFKRAGDEAQTSYTIAMAYYQMSRAKLEILRNDTEDSRKGLRTAATALGDCAKELPPLFDNNLDDELDFARKNGFSEQLKYLLERHKRFDELARVHLEERALVKGLDWFLKAFSHHRRTLSLNEGATVTTNFAEWVLTLEGKRSRPAIEQLGMMIKKVLAYEAELEPKRRKAIHLFQNVIDGHLTPNMLKDWNQKDPEESPVKALVLHGLLQDTSWLSEHILNAVLPRLNAWGIYNTILSKILGASEPSKLAAARRLFGFKPSSSELYATSYYIVAEGSLIAQRAPKYRFATQRNSHNELLVPAVWVDKIIKDEFRAYLNDRLREIYSGLIRSGWTSLYVFKPRVRPTGLFGPVSRIVILDKDFKNRLGMTAVALEAFAPVCHISFEPKPSHVNPSLLQLWVRRLFDVIYPVTGIFEEFTPTRTRRGQPSYPGTRSCIQQFLVETSSADLSTFVIAYSLFRQLEPHKPNIDSILRPAPGAPPNNPLPEKQIIDAFFNWEEMDGLTTVNVGLRTILQASQGPLDAAVWVHLIEAITCEMVFHARAAHPTSLNGFSGLILPYSWARLLAKRYANSQIVRDTSSLEIFLEVVGEISRGLKDHNSYRWWIGQEPLSGKPDIAHILHLRLCWCISLLLANCQPTPRRLIDNLMDSLIRILTGNPYGRMGEAIYHRYGPHHYPGPD
ncbi:hypothetical protein FRC06_006287 [Ceratobasidium sp. 370]|nr:hypothetical protein FRC06_006287 [Ceratobasidium sp. 370]